MCHPGQFMYFNTWKESVILFVLLALAMHTCSTQITSEACCAVHACHSSQCPHASPLHKAVSSQNKHNRQKVWRETSNTELKCPCLQLSSGSAAGNTLMWTPPRHTLAHLRQELFPGLNSLPKLESQVFSSQLNNLLSLLSKDGLEGLSTSIQ